MCEPPKRWRLIPRFRKTRSPIRPSTGCCGQRSSSCGGRRKKRECARGNRTCAWRGDEDGPLPACAAEETSQAAGEISAGAFAAADSRRASQDGGTAGAGGIVGRAARARAGTRLAHRAAATRAICIPGTRRKPNASAKAKRALYEFGCKDSIATNLHPAKDGHFILPARALHGNPYDGHTLKQALDDVREIVGRSPLRVEVDQGYKEHRLSGHRSTAVYITGQRRGVTKKSNGG